MDTVTILTELINCNSYFNNDEIISYLTKFLINQVTELKVIPNNINGKESLVVGVNTPLSNVKNAIVLSGHIDTVMPSNNNTVAKVMDNKIYGLGSCDMKAFLANVLSNLNFLKTYSKPVILVFTGDEETKLTAITNVLQFFQQNKVQCSFVLLGEPTNGKFAVANKGCLHTMVSVKGKSCHSSNPSNGINAIYVTSKLALFLEKTNKKMFKKGSSCNVGVINGGQMVNKVPQSCTMNFDLRVLNMNQVNSILAKVKNYAAKLQKQYGATIEFEQIVFIPPFEKRSSAFLNAIKEVLPKQQFTMFGGTEAGYYQQQEIIPLVYGPGDLALAHHADEHVSVEELLGYNNDLITILKAVEKV